MVSSVAVLDRSRTRGEWVYFKPASGRSTLLAAPWIETVDEDRLVQSNPVVVALRRRAAHPVSPERDYLAGYVPSDDDTPDITAAASHAVDAWADEE